MKNLKLKNVKEMTSKRTKKELAGIYERIFKTYPEFGDSRHTILTRIWKYLKNETCMVKRMIIMEELRGNEIDELEATTETTEEINNWLTDGESAQKPAEEWPEAISNWLNGWEAASEPAEGPTEEIMTNDSQNEKTAENEAPRASEKKLSVNSDMAEKYREVFKQLKKIDGPILKDYIWLMQEMLIKAGEEKEIITVWRNINVVDLLEPLDLSKGSESLKNFREILHPRNIGMDNARRYLYCPEGILFEMELEEKPENKNWVKTDNYCDKHLKVDYYDPETETLISVKYTKKKPEYNYWRNTIRWLETGTKNYKLKLIHKERNTEIIREEIIWAKEDKRPR